MTDLLGTQLNDTLYGNFETNSIFGFAGNDRIYGSSNPDIIYGNSGFDYLNGYSGNDTILSGQDDDSIDAGFGDDILFGNLGSDNLQGYYGNDALFGGQGNDLLEGESNNDWVSGDAGNDTLIGVYKYSFSSQPGLGEIDTLAGGEGADFFVLGDQYESYYVGTGNSDLAVITDFQPELDTIAVTHTNEITSFNITLTGLGAGLGIYDTSSGTSDLIAFLPGVTQSPDLYSYQSGYGLVNASAAVARSVYQANPFPDVSDSIVNPWGIDRVKAPEVWAQGYTGQGVVVAVIDSGVNYNHPDLAGNIWNNPGEIANNGIDDDGNGYTDDVRGWDFIWNDNDPMDFNGHGTHVAGTIAAANNGTGVTGVAPNATIMPIRVLDSEGVASTFNVPDGIRYAADNGADIINLSLGSGYYSADEDAAIQYAINKGVVVVMSSGNDYLSTPGYPAQFAADGGIAVGAVNPFNQMSGYCSSIQRWLGSNRAGNLMDYVVAPGFEVNSTNQFNGYELKCGTSMAAPHVAGVAALMLSANPALTPAQVEEIIVQTANPNGIVV
jgi:Subtilase family/RTX calcium-binding nonapeptide repeat (4 copies)